MTFATNHDSFNAMIPRKLVLSYAVRVEHWTLVPCGEGAVIRAIENMAGRFLATGRSDLEPGSIRFVLLDENETPC